MDSCQGAEVTIIAAKDLKNVNWRNGTVCPYAVVWLDPAKKIFSHVDEEGDSSPVWDEILTIPIPSGSQLEDQTLFIDVVHANRKGEDTKPLIGSATLKLAEFINDASDGNPVKKSVQLKRPSGRPQGKLDLNVLVNASRDKPKDYATPYAASPPDQQTKGYQDAYAAPSSHGPAYSSPYMPPQQPTGYGAPYSLPMPPQQPSGYGAPYSLSMPPQQPPYVTPYSNMPPQQPAPYTIPYASTPPQQPPYGEEYASAPSQQPLYGVAYASAPPQQPPYGEEYASAPSQQPLYGAAYASAPPQQPTYGAAYAHAPPQQPQYGTAYENAPPQQPPYGAAYAIAQPQQPPYEAAYASAPPQQPPYGAAYASAPPQLTLHGGPYAPPHQEGYYAQPGQDEYEYQQGYSQYGQGSEYSAAGGQCSDPAEKSKFEGMGKGLAVDAVSNSLGELVQVEDMVAEKNKLDGMETGLAVDAVDEVLDELGQGSDRAQQSKFDEMGTGLAVDEVPDAYALDELAQLQNMVKDMNKKAFDSIVYLA